VEEQLADRDGAVAYLWGRRATGFAFSPGGPLSAVWYDNAMEERLSGKRWMEDYHQAGGWTPAMRLFRIEGRFSHGVLREMAAGLNLAPGGWCDDP
jgi:hypothetical protein